MRYLPLCLSALLCACGAEPATDPAPPPAPPNIIFLLTDDMRQDMMGFAGNPVIQTPHLDRLAGMGTYFNNSYVTTAICSVSRASILSGQYARRHDLWWFGRSFSPEAFARTYPMLLKAAGYQVGFIGKYGVESPEPQRHFDYWAGFPGQGTYAQRDSAGNYLHLTRKMGRQMTEFLDQAAGRDAPFNLSVSFKAPHVQDSNGMPHVQFAADSAYLTEYADVAWQKPAQASLPDYYDGRFREGNEAVKRWETRFSTEERYDQSLEGYYRLVHGVDVVIGELLAELEARGLADNTVIIFAADNGFYLGEYALAGKWFAHQASIRVPLFVYDPRPEAVRGQRVDEIALNIDIAPTILGLAGLAPPDSMQGRSLLPLVRGERPADWRRDFLYEHIMPGPDEVPYYIPSSQAVVSHDEKYVEYFVGWENDDMLTTELYDLAADSLEVDNLAGRAGDREARLQKRLRALLRAAE